MEFIDKTIEFCTTYRKKKWLTLKKLQENMLHDKQFIKTSDIQKLMFMDKECY